MLQAKVIKGCKFKTVYACSGVEFVKYEFRIVPRLEALENEAKANEFLQVREIADEPELEVVEFNATDSAIALANEKDVDLSLVEGSGQDGKITKPDVDAYLLGADETEVIEIVE